MEIFSRNLINPDVAKGENSFAKLQNLLVDYVCVLSVQIMCLVCSNLRLIITV